MDANQQNNQSIKDEPQTDDTDRRARRSGGSWAFGAILILLGIFLVLQNLTSFELQNWWALFILIPALGSFGNAWRVYQNDGRLSGSARASLTSGIILTMVTAIFLFNLSWTIFGPVLLILAGVGLLLNIALRG